MAEPAKKRRLPVIQSSPDDDVPERPAWQWSLIGALAILLAWVLLANVCNAVAGAVVRSAELAGRAADLVVLAGSALGLALAGLGGGFLVGRFGGKAGRREAMLAGLLAGSLAWSLAAFAPASATGPGLVGWLVALAVVAGLSAGASMLGARIGARRKAPRIYSDPG